MSAGTEATGPLQTFRETSTSARLVLLGVFVNQFGAFLQVFLVLYLVHRGFSESEAGVALACYGAGAVFGMLLGGSLTDRIGPRLTLVLSMFSSAVLVVTVSRLSWYWPIVVVVFAAGMMTQAYRPASATLLIGMTPPSRQVMTMAMNRIALNVGAVGGPLVAAWLITVDWNLIFWVDGATAAGYGLIALLFLPHGRPSRSATTAVAAMRASSYDRIPATWPGTARAASVMASASSVSSTVCPVRYGSSQPTSSDRPAPPWNSHSW
jgi:MFS family permease